MEAIKKSYLSLGATRPAEFAGTHIGAFVATVVITMYAFVLSDNLWLLGICIPLHATSVAITKFDPNGFRILYLHMLTFFTSIGNRMFWRASSSSPLPVPMSRSSKLSSKNSRLLGRENTAARYIPYTAQLNSETVKTSNGDYLQIFTVKGIAHETADNSDINTWHEQLNMFVRGINDPTIALYTHTDHRIVEPELGGMPPAGFSKDLDEKYRKAISKEKLFVTDLYLTIIYRPNPTAYSRLAAKADQINPVMRDKLNLEAVNRLDNIATEAIKGLSRYQLTRLSTYELNGVTFSKPLEFLHYLANGYRQRFPLVQSSLKDCLVTSRPLIARETIEMRTAEKSTFGAMLGFKEYPTPTIPGLLNDLLTAPYEYVLTQSFVCMSKAAAKGALRRQRARLESTDEDGDGEGADITTLLQELVDGAFTMGDHHLTLLIKADVPEDLRDHIAHAKSNLSDAGVVVAREDLALEAAYWSQLPGNFKWRPRPAAIKSYNFVGMSAFHNYPSGKAKGNHWGDAVAVLKTAAGGPYFFNFHDKDLGITMFMGKSGTGKTATQNFLAACATKFGPTGIYFDKDRSSEIFIRANGGDYFTLQVGTSTGFLPFDRIGTPSWKMFVRQLVMSCTKRIGRPFSASEERQIGDAVEGVFDLPRASRRFSHLLQFMDPPHDDNVADRLLKWCESDYGRGSHAWVFDNERDDLDLSKGQLYGFDYTEFLDDPEVRTPIMMYLWERCEELFDGRRLYMFIEEFWKSLEDEFFLGKLPNAFKTQRKQNWFLACATQSPADAIRSRIAHTIIEQTATFIFLPNPQAQEDDYTKGFKLTKQEYETIRYLPESSRQFVVKQGRDSVVCELDLGNFQDELAVLSGTTANTKLVEEIRQTVGNDPTKWLPIFHKERRAA